MATVIKTCTCKHDFQDRRYGKGKRVFNERLKSKSVQEYRCTVCERVV